MKTAASSEQRQRARQARDAFPAMGIYAIRDTASGWARVGSSRTQVASQPGLHRRQRAAEQ